MKINLFVIMSIIFSAAVCCHAFVLEEGLFDLNSETVKKKLLPLLKKEMQTHKSGWQQFIKLMVIMMKL